MTTDDRPWCRGCGTMPAEGEEFVYADEQVWVMDEDDVGYPYCPTCVTQYTEEVKGYSVNCSKCGWGLDCGACPRCDRMPTGLRLVKDEVVG